MDVTTNEPGKLEVTEWSAYGNRRLYFTEGADKIGWVDMKTGRRELANPLRADEVEAYAAAWAEARGIPWPSTGDDTASVPEPPLQAPVQDLTAVEVVTAGPTVADALLASPEPVPSGYVDLANNLAGQAAKTKADELRQATHWFKRILQVVLNVNSEWRSWSKGAEGERLVGAQLEQLGPDWRILHAVPVGKRGSDIDHVLIGPAGVFTINTKNHWGMAVWVKGSTILVNGHRQPYVRNSRHEATRASQLLAEATGQPVAAQALLAIVVEPSHLSLKVQPDDVHVIHYKKLRRWLSAQPDSLAEDQVNALYAAARRSTTWT